MIQSTRYGIVSKNMLFHHRQTLFKGLRIINNLCGSQAIVINLCEDLGSALQLRVVRYMYSSAALLNSQQNHLKSTFEECVFVESAHKKRCRFAKIYTPPNCFFSSFIAGFPIPFMVMGVILGVTLNSKLG